MLYKSRIFWNLIFCFCLLSLNNFTAGANPEIAPDLKKNISRNKHVIFIESPLGLTVRIDNSFLFCPNGFKLNTTGKGFLQNLSGTFKNSNPNLIIEGFNFDKNLPANVNFENSILYAQAVSNFLIQNTNIKSTKIDVYGYGNYFSDKPKANMENYIDITVIHTTKNYSQ